MIELNIKLDNKTEHFKIKNKIEDMVLRDFEAISSITNRTDNFKLKKYIDIIVALSDKPNIVDYLYEDNFYNILKQLDFSDSHTDYVESFELNGITFSRKSGTFNLSIEQLSNMETIIRSNPNNYMSKLMAVIFDKTESNLNLNDRAKKLKDMPLNIALPYIVKSNYKIIVSVKTLLETINA